MAPTFQPLHVVNVRKTADVGSPTLRHSGNSPPPRVGHFFTFWVRGKKLTVAGPNDAPGNRSLVIELKAGALMYRNCTNRFQKPRASVEADSERLRLPTFAMGWASRTTRTSGLRGWHVVRKRGYLHAWKETFPTLSGVSARGMRCNSRPSSAACGGIVASYERNGFCTEFLEPNRSKRIPEWLASESESKTLF